MEQAAQAAGRGAMKIDGNQIQRVLGTYLRQTAPVEPAQDVAAPTDQVSVSRQAGEILKARQAIDALPDVREDRVADIRARLQSGAYTLDDDAVAEAIVKGRPGPGKG